MLYKFAQTVDNNLNEHLVGYSLLKTCYYSELRENRSREKAARGFNDRVTVVFDQPFVPF